MTASTPVTVTFKPDSSNKQIIMVKTFIFHSVKAYGIHLKNVATNIQGISVITTDKDLVSNFSLNRFSFSLSIDSIYDNSKHYLCMGIRI